MAVPGVLKKAVFLKLFYVQINSLISYLFFLWSSNGFRGRAFFSSCNSFSNGCCFKKALENMKEKCNVKSSCLFKERKRASEVDYSKAFVFIWLLYSLVWAISIRGEVSYCKKMAFSCTLQSRLKNSSVHYHSKYKILRVLRACLPFKSIFED